MTIAALVTAAAGAAACVACVLTLIAVRKAYKLNTASRDTYEAAYNVLAEAAKLATDAQTILDDVLEGALRS